MSTSTAPRVAVVVPMYDVAPYVEECVRSLVGQEGIEDVEVVLVDDGSTDGSGELAMRAAGGHPSFRLLRKDQGGPGPGAARNAGLAATTAPLVLFCDGDDLLAPGALAALRYAIERTGAPVAVGAVEQFPSPRGWPWSACFDAEEVTAAGIDSHPQLIHNAAVGNKMFRRDLLDAHGLRFAEGIHHQDTYVSVPALLYSASVAIVPTVVHRYRKREAADSIMDAHFTRVGNYWDHLQVVEHLSRLRERLLPERAGVLDAFLVRSFQGFVLRAPEVLSGAGLADFHVRAASVYRLVPASAVRESTHSAAHRAAYRSLLSGPVREYALLPGRVRRVVARRGRLVIDLPDAAAASADLRVGKATATLVGAVVDGDRLRLTLHVALRRGPHPSAAVNALLCRLVTVPADGSDETGTGSTPGGPGRAVAELAPCGEDAVGQAVATAPEHFVASFPLAAVPRARSILRVAFVTRTGQASCGVVPSEHLVVSPPDLGRLLTLGLTAGGRVLLTRGRDGHDDSRSKGSVAIR